MPHRLREFDPADWPHVPFLNPDAPEHESRTAWTLARAAWLEARGIDFLDFLGQQRRLRLQRLGIPDMVEVRRAQRREAEVSNSSKITEEQEP